MHPDVHAEFERLRDKLLPRGAGDELPRTGAGLALAIADKLDTLAGIFALGEKPTGAKDPFALRRAALGVQRILIEKSLDLDLLACLGRAVAAAHADIARLRAGTSGAAARPLPSVAETVAEVYDFLMERLRAYYLERAAPQALPGKEPQEGAKRRRTGRP